MNTSPPSTHARPTRSNARRARGIVGTFLAFTLAGASLVAAPAAFAEVPQEDDLLVQYDFTEQYGEILSDSSGREQDGTVVGGSGWNGESMTFSGNNYVELPDGLAAGASQISVSTTFKAAPGVINQNIFLWNIGGSGNSATGQFFLSMSSGGRATISPTSGSGEQTQRFTPSLTAGVWTNATVTLDGSTDTMRLYLNGLPAGVKTGVTISPAELVDHTNNLLGASAYTADQKFRGEISSFRVWSTLLTDAEATTVADADLAATPAVPVTGVPTDSLVADYRFGETGGTRLFDYSGSNRHATVTGGEDWTGAGMTFTGSNYVKMPDNLLTGRSQVSVAVNFNPDSSILGNHVFLWNLGGDGTTKQGQLFQSFSSGGRVAIAPAGGGEQSRAFDQQFAGGEWQNAIVTLDGDTDTLVLYRDGVEVRRYTDVTLSPADLTTQTKNLIGASAYDGDRKFSGEISHVRIYNDVLTGTEAAAIAQADSDDVSNSPAASRTLIEQDIAQVRIPDTLFDDIELPTAGEWTSITWESSDPAVISTTGEVTRPAEGQEDANVVLNGTFSYTGDEFLAQSIVTTHEVRVPAESSAEILQSLVIPRWIVGDLPNSIGGNTITWSASTESILAEDGTVSPVESATDVRVTGVVNGQSISGDTTVLPVGDEVLTYVVKGGDVNAGEDLLAWPDSRRSDALHLAVAGADGTWSPLNKGKALLWVMIDGDQHATGYEDWQMGSPSLYRAGDGSIGAVSSSNDNREFIYVWDAGVDAMTFDTQRRLQIAPSGLAVQNVQLVFDSSASVYKAFWSDAEGREYVSVLPNLDEGTVPSSTVPADYTEREVTGTLPTAALAEQSRTFLLTPDEFDAFVTKYAALVNTDVEDIAIDAESWDEVALPDTATFSYNDGSTKDLGVVWSEEELAAAQESGAGTYEITGEVQQSNYAFPFIERRADPHVFYNEDDGYYYHTGSYYEDETVCDPNCDSYTSYGAIPIRRATTIEGLKDAPETLIKSSQQGDRWGGNFWAPEIHKINGTWYIVVAAHDYGEAGRQDGTPYEWVSKLVLIPFLGTAEDISEGKMLDPAYWGGDDVITPLEGASPFDSSYFYDDVAQQGYWILHDRPTNGHHSVVKAVTVEGEFPAFDGAPVEIKAIHWPWENGISGVTESAPEGVDKPIIEGPYLFEYGDYFYYTYSAGTVDKYYTLGQMKAKKGSDILDPASWTEVAYPSLTGYDTLDGAIGGAAQVGSGHNSMVVDEYGNLALVYHARPYPNPGNGGLWDPSRHTAIKAVNVRIDGTLALDVTPDEEVAPEYKTITASVTVAGSEELAMSVTTSTRCAGGKVYLVVKATNDNAVPVGVVTESDYGTKTFASVAAGRFASGAFATRASSVDAGTVTVTATAEIDGTEVSTPFEATYPATTCG